MIQPLQFVPLPTGIFRIRALSDLEADPEPEFAVDGFLKPGDLMCWYGPPKCGKSMVASDFVALLAKGEGRFAGLFQVLRPMRVLYVSTEGKSYFRNRFRAALKKHGVSAEQESNLLFLDNIMPNLYEGTDENNVEAFIDAARPYEPELIIYDTLARAMTGGNENETHDMGVVVENLERIRSALVNSAQLLIHHSAKGSGEIRGSTALAGACDEIIKFTHDRKRGIRSMQSDGMKDAAEFDPLRFDLRPVGERADQVAIDWLGAAPAASVGQRRALAADVAELLRSSTPTKESALTAAEILSRLATKPSQKTLERTLKTLREDESSGVCGFRMPILVGSAVRGIWHYCAVDSR